MIYFELTFLDLPYFIWEFFNSNFFQALTTLLAIGGSAYFGIKSFHSQQKTKRLEKLYFNDSFVKYSNILNENIRISLKNRNYFADVMDCIDNLGSGEDKKSLLKIIQKKIDEIETPLSIGLVEGQLNFLFTDSSDHLAQWISKIQSDFGFLHILTKGQLQLFYKKITDNEIINRDELIKIHKRLNNKYISAERHYIFKNLFDSLIREFAEIDFKDVKSINRFSKNSSIQKLIKNIDESFRLLFGFYQSNSEKDVWYSYAQEAGNHFKIIFKMENNNIEIKSVEKINNISNLINKFNYMILFDDIIGNIIIDNEALPRKLIKITYEKINFLKPKAMRHQNYFIEHNPIEF